MKSPIRELIEVIVLAMLFTVAWLVLPSDAHAGTMEDHNIIAWQQLDDACRAQPSDTGTCASRDRMTFVLQQTGWQADMHGTWFNEAQVQTVGMIGAGLRGTVVKGWTRADFDKAARAILATANNHGVNDLQFLAVLDTYGGAICPDAMEVRVLLARAYVLAVHRTGATVYVNGN